MARGRMCGRMSLLLHLVCGGDALELNNSGASKGLTISPQDSAIVTDDLNDEGGLWADWLSDEGGKRQRKRKRKRSSTSRQPRPSPKLLASSHPRKNEQEQDFSWLREHTEAELDGRSPTLHIPPVSEHPSDDDISWLADPFNIAEEDDRENRSASRH